MAQRDAKAKRLMRLLLKSHNFYETKAADEDRVDIATTRNRIQRLVDDGQTVQQLCILLYNRLYRRAENIDTYIRPVLIELTNYMDINQPINEDGETILFYFLSDILEDYMVPVIELLINLGADSQVASIENEDYTALFKFLKYNSDTLEDLLPLFITNDPDMPPPIPEDYLVQFDRFYHKAILFNQIKNILLQNPAQLRTEILTAAEEVSGLPPDLIDLVEQELYPHPRHLWRTRNRSP
jgi:hypothetical protein